MTRASISIVAVALLVTACGKEAVPTDRLGRAEGAVQTARQTGAQEEPAAALHLRLANDELAQAKDLIKRGENGRARYILLRAEADAQLAQSLHDEANARASAERALADVQTARSSLPQEGQ